MQPKILIVEDDPALSELLQWQFEGDGFQIFHTPDGEEAMLIAQEERPDIILLDWMIENLSGIEVCRRLKRHSQCKQIPIIMLTARIQEDERIRGLDTGADDYLTKPFSPGELKARVNAILRRTRPSISGEQLVHNDLSLDPETHKVRRGEIALHLGPTEYRLLQHFMERPRRVHSREQLLNAVWGHDSEIELRTVDVHIRRLRKALGAPDPIRTIRAAGYALGE